MEWENELWGVFKKERKTIINELKKRIATTICKWGNILSFSLTAKVTLIN